MTSENNKIIIGNVTTIINTLALMFAGLIIGVLSAFGLKLPIDQYGLASIIGLIIATGFAYVNAKYHCTFFDKDEDIIRVDASNLTENQIQAIQNFVDNCTDEKVINKFNDSVNPTQIEEIDPASEYEEE